MKLSDPAKERFEIWYVDGVNYFPAYLVVALPDPNNQDEIIFVNPAKNEIIYKSKSYEDVRQWLVEDDFGLVTGRQSNYT